MPDNFWGKLLGACGIFCLLMAIWVNPTYIWQWFLSGLLSLFLALCVTTAWERDHGKRPS